ncbi:MAG: hypothetical protein ACQESR_01725 [Planctomycetota bacterium]
MESCPTQPVLPLVGLAAENVIRDRYIFAFHTEISYPFRWGRLSNALASSSSCRSRVVPFASSRSGRSKRACRPGWSCAVHGCRATPVQAASRAQAV